MIINLKLEFQLLDRYFSIFLLIWSCQGVEKKLDEIKKEIQANIEDYLNEGAKLAIQSVQRKSNGKN